jgi:hypothetical protein
MNLLKKGGKNDESASRKPPFAVSMKVGVLFAEHVIACSMLPRGIGCVNMSIYLIVLVQSLLLILIDKELSYFCKRKRYV